MSSCVYWKEIDHSETGELIEVCRAKNKICVCGASIKQCHWKDCYKPDNYDRTMSRDSLPFVCLKYVGTATEFTRWLKFATWMNAGQRVIDIARG